MIEKKIGLIGCGNMGGAILSGLISSNKVKPEKIWIYTPSLNKVSALHDMYGINIAQNAQDVAKIADIIFISVKLNIVIQVLSSIASNLNEKSLVISIVAGITLDQLTRELGCNRKIIRAMPNMPSLIREGITSIIPNAFVMPEEIENVINIFRCFSEVEIITEEMIHPIIGICCSSPAYVFMLIEAMADAAVLGGISRSRAYNLAAQAIAGSAQMILKTNKHPGELKDTVCSSGGTSIEAVRILEERGFRSSIIEAVIKCMEKSKNLSSF